MSPTIASLSLQEKSTPTEVGALRTNRSDQKCYRTSEVFYWPGLLRRAEDTSLPGCRRRGRPPHACSPHPRRRLSSGTLHSQRPGKQRQPQSPWSTRSLGCPLSVPLNFYGMGEEAPKADSLRDSCVEGAWPRAEELATRLQHFPLPLPGLFTCVCKENELPKSQNRDQSLYTVGEKSEFWRRSCQSPAHPPTAAHRSACLFTPGPCKYLIQSHFGLHRASEGRKHSPERPSIAAQQNNSGRRTLKISHLTRQHKNDLFQRQGH